MYTSWYDEHSAMLGMANELYRNIKHFTSKYCSAPDQQSAAEYYEDSPHSRLFDMRETVFLFFFDN